MVQREVPDATARIGDASCRLANGSGAPDIKDEMQTGGVTG
jgi:hypothetical protein